MKKGIILILLLTQSIVFFGQESEIPNLLETENTWRKEAFKLPIHFAPKINYSGVEEAQFSKGWSKADSPEFWTYVFVWQIDIEQELSEAELEINLQYYFDGLMNLINKDTTLTLPPTHALFLKKGESNGISKYKGKVSFYDSFFTKDLITLNVIVEQQQCSAQNNYSVLFKFSPKDTNDDIWKKLEKIRMLKKACSP